MQAFDYILDKAGNREQVTESGGNYIQWGYDDLYRLTSETRYNSSDAITWQAGFTYDDAGNRDTNVLTTYTRYHHQ